MKNRWILLLLVVAALLPGCGTESAEPGITAEMAYEGVYQYCLAAYDWSAAEENPDLMGLEMGEETEEAYLVTFRSYTGAFVDFRVDKESGAATLTERVPALGIEEDGGTIDLYDYLERDGA